MESLANLSDLWLMVTKSDHQAYASLHKNLYPGLYNYLFQIVKDEDIVDDLLQELFVKLWHKRDKLGDIKNVKAYFFTASRSMAINYFRQVKSQALRLEKFTQPEIDFSAEDILVSTEDSTELKITIANSLNALPARQREIIYLKFYEEMEYQKIAEITGIQYQSVINHVFRALQTMRSEFKHAGAVSAF